MNTRAIQANPLAAGLAAGEATTDRIEWIQLSLVFLPLDTPISDAKVLTGRQKPLTEIAFLFAEIQTQEGHTRRRLQLQQARRRAGPVRACEGDRAQPDRRRPQRHRAAVGQAGVGRRIGRPQRPVDAGDRRVRHRAVGPEGQARQAAAGQAARRAPRRGAVLQHLGRLPVDARSTRCCATSRRSLERGIGGIKIKVGQPDPMIDLQRVQAVHKLIDGRAHLMVDANQQWDRTTAQRFGRLVEPLNLTWIEEPLDAYDAEGHAALAAMLDTPIATGEMLTSVAEHYELIRHKQRRLHPARRAARRRHHAVPQDHGAGRPRAAAPGAALRDGDPPAPDARRTRTSRGSSTSSGSSRCSTSAWRSRTAACTCRTGRASASRLSEQARRWTKDSAEFGKRG